ncbi:response regulator transcription factor [Sulfurimonas sp.]|uniref:response regulator transcription factor n=1 Tax=Sulfurimonas sp. TaxID=2022749 RepID=UPI003D0D7F51
MKILIVEDDKKIASFLKKGLEEEYFSIDITDNGDEALYLAEVNSYDIVILDIMIHGSDGYEVCKKIRDAKVTTPIIMLSAKSTIFDKVTFLNLGADDYITKPFDFDELLARIKVQLRKKEQSDNILKIADLELNTTTKILFRAMQEIELTAKEYAILEYLLRNKDRIVSEDMLLESISNIDNTTQSNIVNVYIYRLRKKIDKNHALKLIKTYKNQGYKISDKDI